MMDHASDGDASSPHPSEAPRASYWDGFYRTLRSLSGPSSFAQHVAATMEGRTRVLDLGCGDGRDAACFAALGHHVLGLDACGEAIARARTRGSPARFHQGTLASAGPLVAAHLGTAPGEALVYARFLLHAMTAPDAAALLRGLAAAVAPGGRLAFEYRTLADAALPKLHAPHFRRFIDHDALQAELGALGFVVEQAVEAQGLSPVGGEDPVLGRVLARRA
jgi:SAM-dependent methyltransferase